MTAKIEQGKLGIVTIDGEHVGVTVVRVDEDAFRDGVNWSHVRLEQNVASAKRGQIVSSYPDTINDEHSESEVIIPAKAIIMRAERGELGVDSVSIGSGDSIEEAIADTLTRFESGETAHFTETPDAMKGLQEDGFWSTDGHKVQVYVEFYRRWS